MTGIYRTIKARLMYFAGSIVLLCILVLILQYNNFFYTNQYLKASNLANSLKEKISKAALLHQQFVKTEVFNEKFYQTGQSTAIDSLSQLITEYQMILDSLIHLPHFKPGSILMHKADGLKVDCQTFLSKFTALKKLVLDRGFFTTGKSGEWNRFGNYLEELAASYGNNTIYKSVAAINKAGNDYQYNRSISQIQFITGLINDLKMRVVSKSPGYTNELSAADQLKLVNELENYAALTAEIQKMDIHIGLIAHSGFLGDISQYSDQMQVKTLHIDQQVSASLKKALTLSFIGKLVLILIIGLLYLLFTRRFIKEVIRSIEEISRFASELMLGKLPAPLTLTATVELQKISRRLNDFVESLRHKVKFASNLGSDTIDNVLVPLSEEDILSNALLDMEKSLKKADEEDRKYKIDEQKRAWANEGVAKFSEILRAQTDNLSTLSDEIILHLVKYLEANQGSIFLYIDEDPYDHYLELISSFAYDRKKFNHKRIELGEGLVGTCALEKQTIYITDVPDNYIEVSSGLGEASPRNIVIVPMKTEKSILGILEIASFSLFKKHEIDFIEKIAQSIASTFASVKININTNRLLEQSKRQAEEMAQQEEEMRQNFEELQATQEESARKEAEIGSLMQAVDSASLVIQTDMDGRIIEINNKFSQAIKMRKDELLGRYLKNVFIFNAQTDDFYNLIRDLKQGRTITRQEQYEITEDISLYFEMNYSPISDRDGKPYKVLAIASNLTHSKNLEKEINEKTGTLNKLSFEYNQFIDLISEGFIHCILSPDGTIIKVNQNYLDTTGYNADEVFESNYKKFLRPDELKQFELIWSEIAKDKTYQGVMKRTTPTGEEHWLMANIIPFKNEKDVIVNVHFFAQDITEKKLKYQVLEEANKEIERLKGLQKQID